MEKAQPCVTTGVIVDNQVGNTTSSSMALSGIKEEEEDDKHGDTDDTETHGTSLMSSTTTLGPPKRISSLELRKLPVNDLLIPKAKKHLSSTALTTQETELFEANNNNDDSEEDSSSNNNNKARRVGLLKMTCLNPKLDLRTQLMLSFDSVNFITIFLVVLICVVVSLKTGDNIKAINTQTFSTLSQNVQGRTARYLAESLEHRIILRDEVQILYEVVRDRFQGYPTFLDDSQVPFTNMDTNQSFYPIVGTPLPLDWQISNPITKDGIQEHLQGRQDWYGNSTLLSTANGAFVMQGACDPSETDSTSKTYWPNCTSLNNNLETGGIMRPSNLTSIIHRKASDLVPVMKSLYEYNTDIREIGAGFFNNGKGAAMNFPHYELDAQNTYTAIGCEWMREPNPYNTSRSIGTEEQIRECYQEGQVLSAREYNPLNRAWCRDQALHPEKIMVDGPFLNAWVDDTWIVTSGRAVYDRLTDNLVACTWVAVSIDFLQDIMEESRVTENSEVSVVKWDQEGSVVASSAAGRDEQADGDTVLLPPGTLPESTQNAPISNLRLGLTNETYNNLYNRVDYDAKWDPQEVRSAYESFSSSANGFAVAAYPVPPVPDEYDPTYRPVFLTIVSTAEADVFGKVEEVNEDVDERTDQAIWFAVIAGAVGFAIATIVILVTATAITRPLQLMNKDAELIVGSFGDESSSGIRQIKQVDVKCARCVPHTEITDVVREFNKMISNFSGSLMAKAECAQAVEVSNRFRLRDQFMGLYESRESSDNPVVASVRGTVAATRESSVSSDKTARPHYLHTGTNLKRERSLPRRVVSAKDLQKSGKQTTSALFIWIVILIVTPLLVTTITISAVVLSTMSREFDESIKDSEAHYLDVAINALSVYAGLRADFVSTYTSRSVRDLYLMSRVASWIMFDGLERVDSFREIVTEVNECLQAETFQTCPWSIDNFFCDCAWNDPGYEDVCEDYPAVLSRSKQIPYFFVQSDAALSNGTRLRTDFPSNSFSPNTTLWWDGPDELPGSETNESVSNYATTYDRLRTISAFPLFAALSNYDVNKENSNGHFFAFEEDGLWVAYEDCFNSLHTFGAFWNSTEENRAAALRPELCPVGKYGFDPRCRGWYDTGKRKALEQGETLHITAPYTFANGFVIAQSSTTPLIDPRTNNYVGQVLLDFSVTDIFSVLTYSGTPLSTGGFPLLITVENRSLEHDTVIGPGFNGSVSSQPVSEVVMPFDQDCQGDDACSYQSHDFENIVASMKAGNSSFVQFDRTSSNGGTETIYMVHAPITVPYLTPVNASDFSRGAIKDTHLTYSLALAETAQGILEPFTAIGEQMQRQINIAIGILAAVIVIAVAATIGISYLVARSISEPMPCLLELVRLLNSRDWDQDPPMVDQTIGSKEIVNVSNSMESLYRVVRLANVSFHAGDMEAAYRVLVDALHLFRCLNNKKAIGVASNNLGNTMLAMYRIMQFEKVESKFGLSRQDCISRGTTYFHEAIQLGEEAYDEFHDIEGWSPNCLDFMQHLSNRYFNRGIFLLTVKNDHPHPDEIQNLGFRDLQVARDMDDEIESQGEECGWGSVNRLEKLFAVQLVRVRGYLLLLEMGYSDDWEIDENLQRLFQMLDDESRKPSSDLFKGMSYIGRLQQAETEMAKHLLIKGEVVAAARTAIRMLIEDERIFLHAKATAVKVMQAYVESRESNIDDSSRAILLESLEDLAQDLSEQDDTRIDESISYTRSHRIASKSLRNIGESIESKPSSRRRWSIQEQSGHFVTMEQF